MQDLWYLLVFSLSAVEPRLKLIYTLIFTHNYMAKEDKFTLIKVVFY